MNFCKLEATGNDFILLEQSKLKSGRLSPATIARICDRHVGIGADGLILRMKGAKTRWKFFNNDGGEANFCGNAARAFGLYLMQASKGRQCRFESRIGSIRAERVGGMRNPNISVEVPLRSACEDELAVAVRNFLESRTHKPRLIHINSGVPHLVIALKKFPERSERDLISRLAYDHKSAPKGKWNITWLEMGSQNAVTWERGVEEETLSCGSGALACFLAMEKWIGPSRKARSFHFPGGRLQVKRLSSRSLQLQGPARIVFFGRLGSERRQQR